MQNVQYITDVEGHKTAVIFPIEDYEEMLEDLHFGKVARESKDEPKRDFNKFLEEMRQDGDYCIIQVYGLQRFFIGRFGIKVWC